MHLHVEAEHPKLSTEVCLCLWELLPKILPTDRWLEQAGFHKNKR